MKCVLPKIAKLQTLMQRTVYSIQNGKNTEINIQLVYTGQIPQVVLEKSSMQLYEVLI